MAKRAFILGGTGFIGTAVARRFVEAGWNVTVASRGQLPVSPEFESLGVHVEQLDRANEGELEAALRDGADALVDIVAYRHADVEQLVDASGNVGTIIAISTGAVYVDADGRHLWTPYGADPVADVAVPISEDQHTVAPDDETYPRRSCARPPSSAPATQHHASGTSPNVRSRDADASSFTTEARTCTRAASSRTSPRSSSWQPRSQEHAS